MALAGKGWFIWQIGRCENGDPQAIAGKAVASGATHVLIKIAERTYTYNFNSQGRDLAEPLVSELRNRGLQVWGWHYVYGDKPVDEADVAVRRTTQLQLDGYVIDAEAQYKLPGKAAAARTFMAALRGGLPESTLVALSSYRYPSYHPQLPWAAFLEHCDLAMPQVYWEQAHNPAQQLERTLREYSNPAQVGFVRPVIPTGAAYGSGGWRASPAEVKQFLRAAMQLELPAANLYSWDYANSANNTDLWDAAAEMPWLVGTDDVEAPVRRYFEALSAASLERVLNCYMNNAALVTAETTRFGRAALEEYFTGLLADLPSAEYTIQTVEGTGNTRTITWTARSEKAQVLDGEDIFGVLQGVIVYHFSNYTLTLTPDATLMPAPEAAAAPVPELVTA